LAIVTTPFRLAVERWWKFEPGSALHLSDTLAPLAGDELDVVGWVIERLKLGRQRYGQLHLANDTRDLDRERDEEISDALVYVACKALSQTDPTYQQVLGGRQ